MAGSKSENSKGTNVQLTAELHLAIMQIAALKRRSFRGQVEMFLSEAVRRWKDERPSDPNAPAGAGQ